MEHVKPKSPHDKILTMERFQALLDMLAPSESPKYDGGTIEWHTANDFFQAVNKMYDAAKDLLDNKECPTERFDKLRETMVPLTEWKVTKRDK